MTLKTVRNGPHHIIRAALVGPNRHTQLLSFIVDTGATDIILPASMIAKLGFRESELSTISLQTAHGVTDGRRGFLRSVELGGPNLSDVIQRVPVTIEDDQDRIILVKRR